jgi:hypothetical protein
MLLSSFTFKTLSDSCLTLVNSIAAVLLYS